MGVEEDDEQVDEVYRERKVGDEFGARDKDEEKYNTGQNILALCYKGLRKISYQRKLFNIHTKLNIHPTVVSPRKLSHPNMRSRENTVPATRVVNRTRAVMQT